MNVGVLILAAGRSVRFGADKRIATLPDGRRLIDAVLANVGNSNLPFLVCLGIDDNDLASQLQRVDLPCIQCIHSGEGLGGTLAEGVARIDNWDGVLVTLADMPWIKPETYSSIAAQLSTSTICLPVHNGLNGHPVGFGRDFYKDLRSLSGDIGARKLLQKYSKYVRKVHVDDSAINRDVDLPSDIDSH